MLSAALKIQILFMLTVRLTLFATMETINLELIYADLETIERRIDKAKKNSKSGDKKYLHEIEFLERIKAHLDSGKPVRSMDLTDDERAAADELFLLTTKPVIYAANIAEDEIGNESARRTRNFMTKPQKKVRLR